MTSPAIHIQFGGPLAFYFLLLLPNLSTGLNAIDCTNSKKEWLTLRYTSTALLSSRNAVQNFPQNLEVCPTQTQPPTENPATNPSPSCCDRMMEHEMLMLGSLQISQQARLRWLHVANQMKNNSADLQDFFRSDLQQSKDRLNQFFSRIYGYNYKMHRNFFFAFFDDLEGYMAGQKAQLGPLVDNFFNQLRDSIVSLIERSDQHSGPSGSVLTPSQSGGAQGGSGGGLGAGSTDDAAEARRIRCLSERVAQQQPFGGVDALVRTRLLEAYPPARMLVNVLEVASRLLVDAMHQVTNSPDCSLAISRSQFCAVCAGRPMTDTCPETCQRLVSDCLRLEGGDGAQLSAVWPQFIDSIVSVMTRFERAFNFPAVNRYLQMQISEAITNLQSRYTESKSKYQSECRLTGIGGRGNLFSPGSSTQGGRQQQQQLSASSSAGSSWPSPSVSGSAASTHGKWPPSLTPGDYREYRPRRSVQDFRDWHYQQAMQHANPSFPNQPGVQPGYSRGGIDGGVGGGVGGGGGGYLPVAPAQQPPFSGLGSSNNGLGEMNSIVSSGSTDSQEGLIRWAAQLKHRYTSLGNLFADPDGGLCPPALSHQQQHHNGTGKTQCWSPTLPATSSVNVGLSAIVKRLSEAAERLQTSASSTGDPEPLRVMPTSSGSHFNLETANQHIGGEGGSSDWSPGHQRNPQRSQQTPPQQQFPGNQYQQWPPQSQPGLAYGPAFESQPVQPYSQANSPFLGGSGLEPSTLFGEGGYPPEQNRQPIQPDQYGGPNQMPPQLHTNNYQQPPPQPQPHPAFSPDLGMAGSGQLPPQVDTYFDGQGPHPQPPVGGSLPQWPTDPQVDQWRMGQGNNNPTPQWGMQPSEALPDSRGSWPSPSTGVPPPVPGRQTEKNESSSSVERNQTAAVQTGGKPNHPVESTSYMSSTTTTTTTTTNLPAVTTPRSVGQNVTFPSTQPPIQKHLATPGSAAEHPVVVVDRTPVPGSSLPDDEDIEIPPPEEVHKAVPDRPTPVENQPPPSSWTEENTPRWNEPSPSSGFLPPGSSTPDSQGYGWNSQFGASQPDQFLSPSQPGAPGAFQPESTPDTSPAPVYPPHGGGPWGTPEVGGTHPDQTLQGGWMPQPQPDSSGQLPNRWYTPDEPAPGAYPQWPHSGKFDTDRPVSTVLPGGESQEVRPVETSHHAPTEPPAPPPRPPSEFPPFVTPPAVLHRLPMPPPEVWVPAKISPGQSGPPILLVREYNVQGPYYGPEAGSARVCRFNIVPILVTQIISAIMFYPSI